MVDILEKIFLYNDEELLKYINDRLTILESSSLYHSVLGFNTKIFSHYGFISRKTKIKYSYIDSVYSYSMNTIDYYYEFISYIKKNNIRSIQLLIMSLENFINGYFGYTKKSLTFRDNYLNQIIYQKSNNEDEYFNNVNMLELKDFRNKNIAMSTEKSSMAQNILSFFGIESYFCVGNIEENNELKPFCFNIINFMSSYYILDYSNPCKIIYNNTLVSYSPFQGKISADEVDDVLRYNKVKAFNLYSYKKEQDKMKIEYLNEIRKYVVGNKKELIIDEVF